MPTHSGLDPKYPTDYPSPKKYVLVLSCVDARLLDDLVMFLDHDNLANRYYHVTMAGTSLGLTDRYLDDIDDPVHPPACFKQWRTTFIDHVKAAVLLTHGLITDIYIVQHQDCGAFRVYIDKDSADLEPKEEMKLHRDYAKQLLDDLHRNFCTVYNPCDGKPPAPSPKETAVHPYVLHGPARPCDNARLDQSEKVQAPRMRRYSVYR